MEKLYIGTSGWLYKDWTEEFYPPDLPAREHLEFYVQQFPSVEVNTSFYHLPTLSTVHSWKKKAPQGFIYAVKGSRYITHIKRLKVPSLSIQKFLRRISPLGEHLGPILWQLPPSFKRNDERLTAFLKRLPQKYQHAIEFRHPSWDIPEIIELLKEHNAALVSVSSLLMPRELSVTAHFCYIRFHGLTEKAAHDYTRKELRPWANYCRQILDRNIPVYAYFNNDVGAHAPKNARLLQKMILE